MQPCSSLTGNRFRVLALADGKGPSFSAAAVDPLGQVGGGIGAGEGLQYRLAVLQVLRM